MHLICIFPVTSTCRLLVIGTDLQGPAELFSGMVTKCWLMGRPFSGAAVTMQLEYNPQSAVV